MQSINICFTFDPLKPAFSRVRLSEKQVYLWLRRHDDPRLEELVNMARLATYEHGCDSQEANEAIDRLIRLEVLI